MRHQNAHIHISRTYKPAESHLKKDEADSGKETCIQSQKLMVSTKLVLLIWSDLAKQNQSILVLESEHIR